MKQNYSPHDAVLFGVATEDTTYLIRKGDFRIFFSGPQQKIDYAIFLILIKQKYILLTGYFDAVVINFFLHLIFLIRLFAYAYISQAQ